MKVARQASGPSLFAGQPNASLPQRGNGFVDALGDAKYPIAGASILTAANQKALDLKDTKLQRAANGDVVVTMEIPGLNPDEKGALPGGGNMLDASGTPLRQTRFVTRWDFKGQAYYAEATLTGNEGGVSYGSGKVSSGEGQFNGGNVSATLGNTYQPLTSATGTFTGGKLVVRVPAAAAGSPSTGETLYSVGTYALIGPPDGSGSVQALPLTVDSTPTFDTAFGSATTTVPGTAPTTNLPPAVAPTKSGHSLAATGLPVGLAATALVLLLAAGYTRRRRLT